ncbi:MAG: type VII toxin-antitoxin system HepT family RNase toxin [Candidatus Rokuibacteriota bacterium]
MVDRDRILSKLDELDGYLGELRSIAPRSPVEYQQVEKKRACERLLQVAVEALIDACGLLVTGLRLGLPGEEDDLFEKLARQSVLSAETARKRMRRMRNLLVHEYGRVNDQLVFETVRDRLGDFDTCKREIREFLRRS